MIRTILLILIPCIDIFETSLSLEGQLLFKNNSTHT